MVFCLLSLCLSSCIYVDDIGDFWEKGVIDKSIAGAWIDRDNSNCSVFAIDGNNYQLIEKGEKEKSLYRTLVLGNNKFLMVRGENNKYSLIKYQIFSDIFTIYIPDDTKKDEFLQNYPDTDIIISDDKFPSVTIKHLNKKMAVMLQKIADDKKYWKISSVQHHVKKCKEADANY